MCTDQSGTIRSLRVTVAIMLGVILGLIAGIVVWTITKDLTRALGAGGGACVTVVALTIGIMSALGHFNA